jgi:hypothetical protein
MPYVFVAFSVLTLLSDLQRDRWVNVILAGLNAVLAGYAIVAYIGVGRSVLDVWHNVLSWLYKPQRTVAAKRVVPRLAVAEGPAAHWSQTLAYASADGVRRMERRKSSRRGAAPGSDRRSPLGDRRGARDSDENGAVPVHADRRAPTQDEEQR